MPNNQPQEPPREGLSAAISAEGADEQDQDGLTGHGGRISTAAREAMEEHAESGELLAQ